MGVGIQASVTLTVLNKPALTLADTNLCEGDLITIIPTIANASGAINYNWIESTASFATTPTIDFDKTTISTYSLIISDANACKDTSNITITVHPLPIIDAGPDIKICAGVSTTLNATGNSTTYSWAPSGSLTNSTIPNPTATPTSTTTYLLTGTNAFNCTDTSSVIVTVFNGPVPTVSIDYDRDICIGDEVTFTIATSEYLGDNPTYEWHKINPDNSESVISTTNSSTDVDFEEGSAFYLEVISNEICVAAADKNVRSDTVTPKVYQYPDVSISGPATVCFGEQAVFQTTDKNNVANTFTWLTKSNTVLKNATDEQYTFTNVTQETQIKVAATNPSFPCVDTSAVLTVKPIEVFLDLFADDTALFYGASTNLYFATNADSIYLNALPFDGSPQLIVNANKLPVKPLETTLYTGLAFLGDCEATDSRKNQNITASKCPLLFLTKWR